MKRKKMNKPDGRCAACPKWDRWHIRLPKPEDQQKVIELYQKSGAKTKSDYVRGRLLNESFKVIIENKSAEPYLQELSRIVSMIRRIGIFYNEGVKAINNSHSITKAQQIICKLETYSDVLIRLQMQSIQLTIDYQNSQFI